MGGRPQKISTPTRKSRSPANAVSMEARRPEQNVMISAAYRVTPRAVREPACAGRAASTRSPRAGCGASRPDRPVPSHPGRVRDRQGQREESRSGRRLAALRLAREGRGLAARSPARSSAAPAARERSLATGSPGARAASRAACFVVARDARLGAGRSTSARRTLHSPNRDRLLGVARSSRCARSMVLLCGTACSFRYAWRCSARTSWQQARSPMGTHTASFFHARELSA